MEKKRVALYFERCGENIDSALASLERMNNLNQQLLAAIRSSRDTLATSRDALNPDKPSAMTARRVRIQTTP